MSIDYGDGFEGSNNSNSNDDDDDKEELVDNGDDLDEDNNLTNRPGLNPVEQ